MSEEEGLATRLRLARKAAGLTQVEAGKRVGFSQGKIQKIERGAVRVGLLDLDCLIDLYAVGPEEAEWLRVQAVRRLETRSPLDRVHSQAFKSLVDAEWRAEVVLGWYVEGIPGPLQGEHYMLKNFASLPPEMVGEFLARRRERTRVLTSDPAPDYRVLLSESCFDRLPGGRNPQTVMNQAQHLLDLMDEYPRLDLRVLTYHADLSYVYSSFVVVTGVPGDTRDFAYVEYPGGGRTSTSVDRFTTEWERMAAVALDTGGTRKFLEDRAAWDRYA